VERLSDIAGLEPEQDEQRVAFGYLKHPPLQGRSELVSEFTRSLDSLASGRGDVLLVEGGPGSGRTALLDQLAIDAQLRGTAVLRAEGAVHRSPYAAALHLVHDGLVLYPDLQLSFRASSAPLSAPKAVSALEASERQAKVAAGLRDVLLEIGLRAPLVLLVDDAHLIDQRSLALLASMTEAIAERPILLVLSRVSGPAKTDADVILEAAAKRTTLPLLSEQNVIDLVQTMFGGVPNSLRVARWLFAESGGNPGHCVDLAGWLLRRKQLRYARGTFTLAHDIEQRAGHESAQALLADRLTDVGQDGELISQLLAVGGAALSIEELVSATGLAPESVLASLRCLSERSVLVESANRYALASRALSNLVSEALEPTEKRRLHLAQARVLLERPEATMEDRLAAGWHWIQAGGEDALRGANQISEVTSEHVTEVSRVSDAMPPVESALEVYEKLGYSDLELSHLLGTLSVSGFYGDLAMQRRYFERAMRASWVLSGMALAVRLKRWLGPGLALMVGMLVALVVNPLRRCRTTRWPLRQHLMGLIHTVSAAVAAAASALDTSEAERVVAWLEPLAPTPASSALQISRQFSLAVAETSGDKRKSALARYTEVLRQLAQPVRDIEEDVRAQLQFGCLNGIAHLTVGDDEQRALEAADQLAHSAFFAPHAEAIRTFHYGLRGDRVRADEHQARAEARALLGGVSWSAVVLLDARAYAVCLLSDDLLELVRLRNEFERLAHLSPGLAAQHRVTEADLLRLRGRPGEALPIYAEVLASEAGRSLPTYGFICAWYARALLESGEAARAKATCEAVLGALADDDFTFLSYRTVLEQQLALAEATLGNGQRAANLLDALVMRHAATRNPLLLGSLERDRAHVALLARDEEAFERSFAAMQAWFRATQTPCLIQQCDLMLARAVRAGVRAAQADLLSVEPSFAEVDGSTVIDVTQRDSSRRLRRPG
jgi:RecA/RadA recombinase